MACSNTTVTTTDEDKKPQGNQVVINKKAKTFLVFGFSKEELKTTSVNRMNAYVNYLQTNKYNLEAETNKTQLEKNNFSFLKKLEENKIPTVFLVPNEDVLSLTKEEIVKKMQKDLYQRQKKSLLEHKKRLDNQTYDAIIFDRHTQGFIGSFETGTIRDDNIRKHFYDSDIHKQFVYYDSGANAYGPAIWNNLIDFFDLVLDIFGHSGSYIIFETGISFNFPSTYKIKNIDYSIHVDQNLFNQYSKSIINDYHSNQDNREKSNNKSYHYIKYKKGSIEKS